ncbi:HAD hydrolase-like protein, partial [Staphylococcus epidermidis]|uniref:HAD hydrolase-like protein n=1 Tax=Staphylococcus epidermidis TaxID=1282 RepID=UPI0037D99884
MDFHTTSQKIPLPLLHQLLQTFPLHHREPTHPQLRVVHKKINPHSLIPSPSLPQIIQSCNPLTPKQTSHSTNHTTHQLIHSTLPQNNSIHPLQQTIQPLTNQGYHIPILTTHTKKPLHQFLHQTQTTNLFHLLISTQTHPQQNPHPKLLHPLFNPFHLKPQNVPILPHTTNHMKTPINPHLPLPIP